MTANLPSQKQLVLPLLEVTRDAGGRIRSGEAYEAIAARLLLSDADLDETISGGNSTRVSKFRQRVRWARQKARDEGLLVAADRGIWELTNAATDKLANNHSGIVFTIFETELGQVLWGSAEHACAVIEPGTIDLIYTSPPYPLLQPKEYGNLSSSDWLKWMGDLSELWSGLMSNTGSLVVNIGSISEAGKPFKDPYAARFQLDLIDRLGLHLVDEHYWHNPAKLPSPVQWVSVQKKRLKNSVEHILWFAKTNAFKSNNDNVREPESPHTTRYRKNAIASGKGLGRRPGGSIAGKGFLRSDGTSIPSVLQVQSHEGPHSIYRRACKQAGIKPHPAISPLALPDRFIRLTTEPGDLVYDPMAGSLATCFAAEQLGRRWIGSELSAHYIAGGTLRFETRENKG
tara:strand:+ start:24610 stop:25812 length:1203 start_codon:yes stop_codon:yes gene_type:complete